MGDVQQICEMRVKINYLTFIKINVYMDESQVRMVLS